MTDEDAYNYYESPDYRESILGNLQKHIAILIFILICVFSVSFLFVTEKPNLSASVLIIIYFGILLYIAWADNGIKGGKEEASFIDKVKNYWKGVYITDNMIVVFREENNHLGRNSLRLEYVEDIELVDNFGEKSSVIVYGDERANLVATSKNAQEIYNIILLNKI